MDANLILAILSSLLHVWAAIALMGGAIYLRCALIPAASELPDDAHDGLKARLKQRWKKVVMIGIAVLLLSGFYNYLVVGVPSHQGQKLYHPLMGVKMLLAFGVFFLASALVGRSAKFESLRQHPKKWLSLLIVLSTIVVGIGSVLKVAAPPNPPAAAAAAVTAE